ncbi:MAG: hypothetical protein WD097_07010 [Balneolales bacterium]
MSPAYNERTSKNAYNWFSIPEFSNRMHDAGFGFPARIRGLDLPACRLNGFISWRKYKESHIARLFAVCLSGFIVIITGFESVSAQITMGGRNIAMGQAHTAFPEDPWAVFHNPALISNSKSAFGVFTIRYYGMKELEDHTAVINLPVPYPFISDTPLLGMSVGLHTYGFELYRETQLRNGWSLHREQIQLGIAVRYIHVRIEGYDSAGSGAMDAGLTAELFRGFRIGYRVSNLFYNRIGTGENALLPQEMAVGISWNEITGLLLTFDIVKDPVFPFSVRAAIESNPANRMYIRGGWTSNPFTWSAGAGFDLARFQSNLAIQNHPVLGLSPGIDCLFRF